MIESRTRIAGAHRFEHDAMATTFGLTLAGVNRTYARQAAQAAFAEIDRLELLFSRFVETSEVSQIRALPPGEPLTVSLEISDCLQLAARIFVETGGAFDIAYRTREGAAPAVDAEPLLFYDPDAHAVGVRRAGVELDLGGIGKGYAVDRVVALLRDDWQIRSAMVHGGASTVFALGAPPVADHWEVGLRRPDADSEAPPWRAVLLKDVALSGSGQLLHGRHIVDPRHGTPVDASVAAWALAPTAAESDALSTAFMVLEPEAVRAYCEQHPGVGAILRRETPERAEVVEEYGCWAGSEE